MTGEGWRLSEDDLRGWLAALVRQGKQLVAPSEEQGLLLFRPVGSAQEVCLTFANARWSPKEFLFPRSEALLSYRLRGDDVLLGDPQLPEGDVVLFGVRPCDAAGLSRLDEVFAGTQPDPHFARRREQTAVVCLACDRTGAACFCTAVGGSPSGEEGSDVQVVSLDGAWLLHVLTPRGERLVAGQASSWTPATHEDSSAAAAQRSRLEASIEQAAVTPEWASDLEKSFEDPVWESIGRRCLGCGICAYVCPSCSCFDVNDEGDSYCGTRCRSWDSCAFALFTRHASGHNPRPTQASRYRQRVLHKFAYFPAEHAGRLMCVGCGRCLELCPVGVDIHRSVHAAVESGKAGEESK